MNQESLREQSAGTYRGRLRKRTSRPRRTGLYYMYFGKVRVNRK